MKRFALGVIEFIGAYLIAYAYLGGLVLAMAVIYLGTKELLHILLS